MGDLRRQIQTLYFVIYCRRDLLVEVKVNWCTCTCYLLKDVLSKIVLHPFRALAHVIRHPASDHTDDIGLGQHYENIQTRVTIKSLRKYYDLHSTLLHNYIHIHTRERFVYTLGSIYLFTNAAATCFD